jgi:L-ascorbate metabolism protein UlaG (beta-lactamase superfamily)
VSLALTYLGHATVLIELDGERLLTDPLLREKALHLRRAVPAPRVEGVGTVLISHGHYDHLDLRSLDLLDHGLRIVVPRGLGGLLRRRGFAEVVEVGVGESAAAGAVRIRATPAAHSGARLAARAPALGYLLRGSQTVYFAGDTGLFAGLEEIGREGIDVALLPVWGWGARLGSGHLDPERAADAAGLLQARLAVPIHWGTYGAAGADLSRAPAERFARACARVTDTQVRILEPGERLALTRAG